MNTLLTELSSYITMFNVDYRIESLALYMVGRRLNMDIQSNLPDFDRSEYLRFTKHLPYEDLVTLMLSRKYLVAGFAGDSRERITYVYGVNSESGKVFMVQVEDYWSYRMWSMNFSKRMKLNGLELLFTDDKTVRHYILEYDIDLDDDIRELGKPLDEILRLGRGLKLRVQGDLGVEIVEEGENAYIRALRGEMLRRLRTRVSEIIASHIIGELEKSGFTTRTDIWPRFTREISHIIFGIPIYDDLILEDEVPKVLRRLAKIIWKAVVNTLPVITGLNISKYRRTLVVVKSARRYMYEIGFYADSVKLLRVRIHWEYCKNCREEPGRASRAVQASTLGSIIDDIKTLIRRFRARDENIIVVAIRVYDRMISQLAEKTIGNTLNDLDYMPIKIIEGRHIISAKALPTEMIITYTILDREYIERIQLPITIKTIELQHPEHKPKIIEFTKPYTIRLIHVPQHMSREFQVKLNTINVK